MEACSTASGGVMFVPDHIEGGSRPLSYREFVQQEHSEKIIGPFGRKRVDEIPASRVREKVA
ncbi:MAG TPA: hypothetical protein PK513_09115 [Alphaproteobacteria bacterium]|nr:hypothetical protein [Alphaproteobacteria bacterium]USO05635.1 MAG: hypothetical protein H6859_00030 [Rhodospirillales bacterium]HOO82650.1 hypothetical protein [Alphaproteobacteria bacterium]